MVNQEDSRDFRCLNAPLKDYWKGVKAALDEPLVVRDILKDGFWSCSRITEEPEDRMREDGPMREEFAQDPPFIKRKHDRRQTSFCINKNCFADYFVVVRPVDDDSKPFWLARALTNLNPDPRHIH